MPRLSLISTLLTLLLLLGGCVTSDWDSGADLSMTDKDPWEYYSDVYLDYANGRLNIAVYEAQAPATGTAQAGSSASGSQLVVFFDDVHVQTHSLSSLNRSDRNINTLLFCGPGTEETGPLTMETLPGWISKQLSAEEQALFELAKTGNEAARDQFAGILRSRVETPWATGLECLARQWEAAF